MLEDANDYGTIAKAIGMGAAVCAKAMNRDYRGGTTGFQAGDAMWTFLSSWMYPENKCGMRIINYDRFLYPQYEFGYDKTISRSTWEAMQEQANKNLNEDNEYTHYNVIKHWKSIVAGEVPFGYKVER